MPSVCNIKRDWLMGLVLAVTPMSTCSSIVLCVIVTGHGACIVVGFVAARHKKVNRSGSEVSSLWKLGTAVLCFVFCVFCFLFSGVIGPSP